MFFDKGERMVFWIAWMNHSDDGGHEHDRPRPQNNLLAIRLYHVIYTVLRTGTRWHGSSTCKKQSVCVKD